MRTHVFRSGDGLRGINRANDAVRGETPSAVAARNISVILRDGFGEIGTSTSGGGACSSPKCRTSPTMPTIAA